MRLLRACFVVCSILTISVVAVPTVSDAAPAPINGTVFRDHDQDGERDARDVGLADITVVVTDGTGAEIARTTTAADGTYSAVGTDDSGQYRVEFEWTATYLWPSALGSENGSSVQFGTGGDSIDFALANPADFCASADGEISYATTCFVNGDPNGPAALNGDLDTIVATVQATGVAGSSAPAVDKLATASETGATYGLAYEPVSDRLFTAAYLKRHVGLGTGGINAFYALDLAAGTTSLWYDAIDAGTVDSSAARGLPDDLSDAQTSLDAAAFGQIGKVGWGDIDLSENRSTLFAANLFDRNIYAIDVAAADAGSTTAHTSLGRPALACPNGVARPFGLAVRDGQLFAGVTCTAELGGDPGDLSAHVYAYDLALGTWSADSVLDVPLDFADGCLLRERGCENHPWVDTFSYADFFFTEVLGTPFEFPLRAQPILSDIEFDTDGDMIIGIRDRQSDQFGHRNQTPDGSGNLVTAAANGDLFRAAAPTTPGGPWVLESAGVVGGAVSSGTGTARSGPGGPAAPQGPGGGEFYWTDFVTNGAGDFFHAETFMGGLASVPGEDSTASTQIDPIAPRLDAGGITWVRHDDGAAADSIEIYRDANTPQPPTLGKANGLGDLEALCPGAPVEIGNRAWFDRNRDGIQDADEEPLPGVVVTLSDGRTVITDADGLWSFSVDPETAYTIEFDPSGADVSAIAEVDTGAELVATLPTAGTSTTIDSNIDPATLAATVVSNGPGENDHSIDAGFAAAPPAAGGLEIGNLVWLDSNNNGIAELDEPGLPGVLVELWQDADLDGDKETKVTDQLTDAEGHYVFSGLGAGSYGVVVPDQSGPGQALEKLRSSTPTEADPDDDTDNDDNGIDPPSLPADLMSGVLGLSGDEPTGELSRDGSADFDLPSAGILDTSSNLTVDFGFFPTASLGDTVWFDSNDNGIQDPGEIGVPEVTVDLCDAAGETIGTTVTGPDGTYSFDFLPPGDYLVCFDLTTLPPDYTVTTPNAGGDDELDSDGDPDTGITVVTTLDPFEDDDSWDLGIVTTIPLSSLGDKVWFDDDKDGVQDSDEDPVPDVTVHLCDTEMNTLATTVTDADGMYIFDELPPGDYVVCFDLTTLPDDYRPTTPNAGGDDSVDSDADPTTGKTPVTSLDPGEHDPTLDLGISTDGPLPPTNPPPLPPPPTPPIPVTGSGLAGPLVGSGLIIAGLGFGLLSQSRSAQSRPAQSRRTRNRPKSLASSVQNS